MNARVDQPCGKAISLGCHLKKLPAGWKVYDIEADGLGMVVDERDSFAAAMPMGGFDATTNCFRKIRAA